MWNRIRIRSFWRLKCGNINLDQERKKRREKIKKRMEANINPPVKVGEVLKLGIVRFGRDGDPIMIHKNFIIFLKDADRKDVQLNVMFEIKITKVLPNFAFAVRVNGK